MKMKLKCFCTVAVTRLVRRLSLFAWEEMLWDVSRVEWKYGRTDDGKPKDWDEWNNVRDHLREVKRLRKPEELYQTNAELTHRHEREKCPKNTQD